GVPIKLLPVGGVAATTENVQNGTFPLSRSLTLVTKNQPEGLDQKFIEFARGSLLESPQASPEVQDIVKEQNFVPLSE
ncbi:MAG: hypothetical protein F6J92_23920, partial [Symploca sp. SIO1A3]|nr:hypothetical protein [Symploca sp. SIO1A3]